MVPSLWYRLRLFLLGAGLIAGFGCAGGSHSRFYTLGPLPPPSAVKTENEAAGRALAIGVGPVRLPQYLSGREIVTRTDPYNIDLAEFDRWGGSLQDDFTRNLLENLSLYLANDRTSLYSYPAMGAV
ncbi:MAG TPA: ABC-type transport auxiliary lipoprotein family protein, partial [Candidatus Acidoferrum sp.]|nr:ABC-type transport auxiliary lipoprotein family protein [Candidatus Acidoferrum sp.]